VNEGAPAPEDRGHRLEPGSLAAFLDFLWRHRQLIVLFTGIPVVVAVVVLLIVPPKFTAHAVLLPQSASEPGIMSAIASVLGGASLPFSLGSLGSPETAIQEGILGSERLADSIDAKFDLKTRYKTRNRDDRLRRWRASLKTGANQSGLLTVEFTDKDPRFATAVVAELIEQLDLFNREYRTTGSRRKREFVEQRLDEARFRIAAVESLLVDFQQEHQSLALSPTSEAVVNAGADLVAQRLRLEMEVQVLRKSLSPSAPAIQQKQSEIDALDRELVKLPEMGASLADFLRELKVRESTYAWLAAQLEEARIDEARDTRTVDVLDPPVVPERKSWPKRSIVVLIVGGFCGLLSLVAARLADAWRTARDAPAEAPR